MPIKPSIRRRFKYLRYWCSQPYGLGLIGIFAFTEWRLVDRRHLTLGSTGIVLTLLGAILQENTSSERPTIASMRLSWPPTRYQPLSLLPMHILIGLQSLTLTLLGAVRLLEDWSQGTTPKPATWVLALFWIELVIWLWASRKTDAYWESIRRTADGNPGVALRRARRTGWRLIVLGLLLQFADSLRY